MSDLSAFLPQVDWSALLVPTHRLTASECAFALHGLKLLPLSGLATLSLTDPNFDGISIEHTLLKLLRAVESGEVRSDATTEEIRRDPQSAQIENLNKADCIRWAVRNGYELPEIVLARFGIEATKSDDNSRRPIADRPCDEWIHRGTAVDLWRDLSGLGKKQAYVHLDEAVKNGVIASRPHPKKKFEVLDHEVRKTAPNYRILRKARLRQSPHQDFSEDLEVGEKFYRK